MVRPMRWCQAVRPSRDRDSGIQFADPVNEALTSGVDTVLNLGAGMDTRPYRMKLPGDLRWVEFDFPSIVEPESAQLADQQPVCEDAHLHVAGDGSVQLVENVRARLSS
jgi:O-methyltransferase involved in polyketide biosynthesis